MRAAVLGANGLLGSDLVKFLSSEFEVTSITRENYEENRGKEFDIFINANGNSKRFWALQNVYQDFEASTISVYKTIFDFKFKKYIYISSVDVYPDPSNPTKASENNDIDINLQNAYGFHKYLSEQIVKKHIEDWVILRPSMILGTNLKKGPFFDILNGSPIFVTPDTQLQLITAEAISQVIKTLVEKNKTQEIYNTGGKGVFEFSTISKYFKEKINISDEAKRQQYEMDVTKLEKVYQLKTSEEYFVDWLKNKNG